MKVLDVNQTQKMYITPESQSNEGEKSKDLRTVLDKEQGAEITISQEGLAAWAEEIKKRAGNVGMLTGWEDPGKYAVGIANDVSFEHLMNLGKVWGEIHSKAYNKADSVDAHMKSLLEAYEIVYGKILEQHKEGNREANYDTGSRSITLEEDLKALDEAYDQWVESIDNYVSMWQRIKSMRSTSDPEESTEEPECQSEDRKRSHKRFMTKEYHEYRRNITVMMNQGRQELLAAFKTPGEKAGLAKNIITNLMNNCPGFWLKTRELRPDTK